jgi:hypothetical protein
VNVINLLWNCSIPEFPTLYLVNSPEIDEVKAREGYFDGVVGMVEGYQSKESMTSCEQPQTTVYFLSHIKVIPYSVQ